MKTFSPDFNQFAIDSLRLELLKKIGWRISKKSDCARLSELIAQSGLGLISESTLYRLFFQFEKHRPYNYTIDILCKFIGYKDSIDFLNGLKESIDLLQFNGITLVH